MALQYTITFYPGRYYVCPMGQDDRPIGPVQGKGQQQPIRYWAVVDETTRLSVAFAFDENSAKVICLALDFMNAQMQGDSAKVASIQGAIDKIAGRGAGVIVP